MQLLIGSQGLTSLFVSFLCRNGRLSKLWGLWTVSASKLMWVQPTSMWLSLQLKDCFSGYEGFWWLPFPPCCPLWPGNHSCIPNAEASFPDNNFLLQLSALRDISPGEVSWHVWVWSDKYWPGIDGTEHPILALCAPLSGSIRRLRLWGLEWVCQAVRKIEKPCICTAQ